MHKCNMYTENKNVFSQPTHCLEWNQTHNVFFHINRNLEITPPPMRQVCRIEKIWWYIPAYLSNLQYALITCTLKFVLTRV